MVSDMVRTTVLCAQSTTDREVESSSVSCWSCIMDASLPPGWEWAQAPDGRIYYCHRQTGQTTWFRPSPAPSLAPAPAPVSAPQAPARQVPPSHAPTSQAPRSQAPSQVPQLQRGLLPSPRADAGVGQNSGNQRCHVCQILVGGGRDGMSGHIKGGKHQKKLVEYEKSACAPAASASSQGTAAVLGKSEYDPSDEPLLQRPVVASSVFAAAAAAGPAASRPAAAPIAASRRS
jgi:hypothetical protein